MTTNPAPEQPAVTTNQELTALQNNFSQTKKLAIILTIVAVIVLGIGILVTQQRKGRGIDPSSNENYQQISESFGKSDKDDEYKDEADLNGDGAIDVLDYQILSKNLAQ